MYGVYGGCANAMPVCNNIGREQQGRPFSLALVRESSSAPATASWLCDYNCGTVKCVLLCYTAWGSCCDATCKLRVMLCCAAMCNALQAEQAQDADTRRTHTNWVTIGERMLTGFVLLRSTSMRAAHCKITAQQNIRPSGKSAHDDLHSYTYRLYSYQVCTV